MAERLTATEPAPTATNVQALAILAALVPVLALYVWLHTLLALGSVMMFGFLFVFYWASIMSLQIDSLLPSLTGALFGLGIAYLLGLLPALWGAAGIALLVLLVGGAIYLLIRGRAPFAINNALMLMLTVGSSGLLHGSAAFASAAASVAVSALFVGLPFAIGPVLRRSRRP